MEKTNERRSGRTIRIVDAAVQTFFKEGKVTIADHQEGQHHAKYVLKMFLNRLDAEHGGYHPFYKVDGLTVYYTPPKED